MIAEFLDRPEVAEVLKLMCFECAGPCQIYRAGGNDIARRAEDEQAFVMRRALGFVASHGADWRTAMGEEMQAIVDRAAAKKPFVGDAAS